MSDITKQTVSFQNDMNATVVLPTATAKVEDIISALSIPPYKAVILNLGGADSIDDALIPRLAQLFGRGIAKAAAEANAVVIDGGTQSGVIALMGEGVAGRGNKSTLVGIAPLSKVSYPETTSATGTRLEPNHSHFVLVEGNDWGNETAMMFQLVSALINNKVVVTSNEPKPAKPDAPKAVVKVPCLAVLVGGGSIAKNEVLRAVRQNIPLIVVEGSGKLADEIAVAWKNKQTLPDDPVMAEIIAEGDIQLHQVNNSVKGIERLIIRELGIDNVLMQAWETFADYDLNANLQQKRFDRLQLAIILLGVVGTALVVIQQVFAPRDQSNDLLAVTELWKGKNYRWWIIYHLLILTPILLTVLVAASNRFKQGSKWLLLRAGAESIKREIFRYRTRAMYYKQHAEQQLAQRIEAITQRTMRTEVNVSSLKPYNKDNGFPPHMFAAKGGDDGFSYLTPDRYVEVRLGDQLNFFQRKALRLERQFRGLYWLTFIIGGLGTYVAAIGLQAWIALTTSLVAAIGTYLGYRQTENTLTKYNQAATDLSNVRAWWNALSAEEQADPINIDSLVEHTEQVLQSELDGWIQQMQNALAELRKGQGLSGEREEKKEPQEASTKNSSKKANNGLQSENEPNMGQTNTTITQAEAKDSQFRPVIDAIPQTEADLVKSKPIDSNSIPLN